MHDELCRDDAELFAHAFADLAMSFLISTNLQKPYPNVRPADKSLKKIKARLTELTGRKLTPIPLRDVVGSVNRSLRGWANYFHYRNSSLAMSKVRYHAEDRLRTHLMKRHKVKDRGTALPPVSKCSSL
jgi:benzoyl-CoA reductase/2-hydroxyglutaryl-CoA dehydratase subunit BcrC/BadD/HgdB